LASADIVTIHACGGEANNRFLDDRKLSLMKKGSLLINCARGGLVDETALYNQLKAGHLGGAALDVFEQEPYQGPLRELDNVILTAHIGSYAKEARIHMELEAVKNLLNSLKEGKT
jgi:D-3-phosphoglycerate dehydrogenase / 2-oxoglutarate reductase